MAKGIINGGACGYSSVIEIKEKDSKTVSVDISSNCPNIKKIAKELKEVEPFKELFSDLLSTLTYRIASKYISHPSCVVPSGILKTIEVQSGLSFPQEANIKVEK